MASTQEASTPSEAQPAAADNQLDDESARQPEPPRSRAVAAALRFAGSRPVQLAAIAVLVAVGVALRFVVHSALWLDEAQAVSIARAPLSQLTDALRHDGAPPLYYVLLHLWIQLFGTSAGAVRSLSGLFSLLAVPLVWVLARDFADRRVATVAVLFVVTSPFANDYATEARMYSLVLLLTLLLLRALQLVLARPTIARGVLVAGSAAALLLSHYWAIPLLFVIGLALAVLVLRRGLRAARAEAIALACLAAGAVLFLPWLPALLFQRAHTGTPWAPPASLTALPDALASWTGGLKAPTGGTLHRLVLVLMILGAAGRPLDRRQIVLSLTGYRRSYPLLVVSVGVLAVALVVSHVSGAAYSPRYTTVAYPGFILLSALGVMALPRGGWRPAVVAVVCLMGLVGGAYSVFDSPRTQAAEIAAALRRDAKPGDVVGFCPDQLAPAVARLAPKDVQLVTFPRLDNGERVDWVDYRQTVEQRSVDDYSQRLLSLAGPHRVFLVWQGGYESLGPRCETIAGTLQNLTHGGDLAVRQNTRYYEPSSLSEYPPAQRR